MLIHICTFQYIPIPVNMYNLYLVYNVYKYIQICTNTVVKQTITYKSYKYSQLGSLTMTGPAAVQAFEVDWYSSRKADAMTAAG